MAETKKKILFVCLGNICRSPMAMAIFKNLTDEWYSDSAAIGHWHVGEPPDSRAVSTMKSYGITLTHSARLITKEDFENFDVIMGMDHDIMVVLNRMAPWGTRQKVTLITTYDPEKAHDVPDPYYDPGDEGFHNCYRICLRSLKNFLQV